MPATLRIRILAVAAMAVAALAAGCGDESGQDETTAPQVSIPSPTSPLATETTASTPPAGQKKQKKQSAPATGGTAAGCSVPANYEKFEFAGTDCATALAVAGAWEADPNRCNTIDDPDSPEGYSGRARSRATRATRERDVRSDGRCVACTMGGASVRFTWFPN